MTETTDLYDLALVHPGKVEICPYFLSYYRKLKRYSKRGRASFQMGLEFSLSSTRISDETTNFTESLYQRHSLDISSLSSPLDRSYQRALR
jgi:hypothetical protein